MISAGHCQKSLHFAQFELDEDQHVHPRNLYEVDRNTIIYKNYGKGNDFAVFKLKPNRMSGLLPGQSQGHYKIQNSSPKENELIQITGHGSSKNKNLSFSQQSHHGRILSISNSYFDYDADTTNGNSGSAVISLINKHIIGVHTHGSCHAFGGSNSGTLISNSPEFQKAIYDCLQQD